MMVNFLLQTYTMNTLWDLAAEKDNQIAGRSYSYLAVKKANQTIYSWDLLG